jgi:hypothetical protein
VLLPSILCSIPLDIPVNELVRWKQLTGGPTSKQCAAVGATGIDPAVPAALANTEGCRAVDREEPPEAIRDIIRVWGVLNSYRPQSQRRWSKALVRHGADASQAIAAVLGVPAGDLVTRDHEKH